MSAFLEIDNLAKYFHVAGGTLHAVDGVTLSIEQGSTLGVVGESGCGKSTLGRTVLMAHTPTSGDVRFKGRSLTGLDRHELHQVRRNMQMIFQDPYASLNPRMCVEELIAEPILIYKLFKTRAEVDQHVRKLMDTVGLAQRLATAYPHELDGGRRQRIGVARALALNPEFIVCDEPVSALDVSIQAQILNLLMDLQDNLGLTYMFITHDLSVVRHISKYIAVMYLGKCVEYAPAKELFIKPLHPYTQALLGAIPVPKLEMRNKRPNLIKGELSSPINPAPGCRFAPRCPFASAECSRDVELKERSAEHFVACVRE